MARRHAHRAQVVTRFARIPEEVTDGKVRCNGCGRVISLTKSGRTRVHRTPAGEPCAYRVVYGRPVELGELPPIVIPERREPSQRRESSQRSRADKEPARLEVGSECDDCGRWLPGERHVCGRCANARAKRRREEGRKSRGAA